jgi:hypothetical protein
MVDSSNVKIIYGDQMTGLYDSIDDVIDIEGLKQTSEPLKSMFPATESFDWPIFVERLLGLDDFAENKHFNEKLTKELIENVDQVYEEMYAQLFTGPFAMLACF